MKFKSQIVVLGAKSSKGEVEGNAYDHTTIYSSTSLDESKGTSKGEAGTEYRFGHAGKFDEIKHNTFPFTADCEFEIVTSGKVAKTVMLSLVPVRMVAPTAKAA